MSIGNKRPVFAEIVYLATTTPRKKKRWKKCQLFFKFKFNLKRPFKIAILHKLELNECKKEKKKLRENKHQKKL